MTQTYTQPLALFRLRDGKCPECGAGTEAHDGWGGPRGCSLTDNGVAARIARQRDIDYLAAAAELAAATDCADCARADELIASGKARHMTHQRPDVAARATEGSR